MIIHFIKKRIKKFPTILIVLIALTVRGQAQNSWFGVLSSAAKVGKAITLTDEEMSSAVASGVKMLDEQNKICAQNSAYAKRLRKLTVNMTDADGIDLNFKVYQTNELNAFACPDGSVRVYSALMDLLTDDELLGVIGHEVGHVALRHAKRAWKWALLRSAASDAVGAVSETWADLSGSLLGAVCSAALTAKHSRFHESEADDFGYAFLKECGRNPWAMGKAFIKMKKLSARKSDSRIQHWLQAFSSHPDFDARIERMRQRAKEDGYATDDW